MADAAAAAATRANDKQQLGSSSSVIVAALAPEPGRAATKRELMRQAQAQLQQERDRVDQEKKERLRARAKEQRWKSYGPDGQGFATTGLKRQEYWKWKGEPTPDTVLAYKFATGRAAYPFASIMAPLAYPCGPIACAQDQPYEWRPGYDPAEEEARRERLKAEELAIELELNPPPPVDKKSLECVAAGGGTGVPNENEKGVLVPRPVAVSSCQDDRR
jgi:hypothetical protein